MADFIRFAMLWQQVAEEVHGCAVDHGWWEGDNHNDGEKIALMHSELSEALEGLRHGNPPSDKIGAIGFSQVEEELADVVIRLMDFAVARGFDIGGAIKRKHAYNETRPYKHGGKKF